MATILSRIFLLYNLLNATILYLVPKKLRNYISPSFVPCSQQDLTKEVLKTEDVSTVPSTRNVPYKMELGELKNIYQMFDKNGDGRITKNELNDSLESMGIFMSDVDLTLMIEKIDSNSNGCVDFDEFGALYEAIMADQDGEEAMREAFSVFDQNKDGFISFEELKTVLASLGLKQGRTVEDCKEMIMKVDVDGDGMVDYTEFKRMMRGDMEMAIAVDENFEDESLEGDVHVTNDDPEVAALSDLGPLRLRFTGSSSSAVLTFPILSPGSTIANAKQNNRY